MDSDSTNLDPVASDRPPDLVELKVFGDVNSAELAKGVLEANGFECWITSDDCGGMLAAMDTVRGVKLLVRPSDLEAARKLLAADVVGANQSTLREENPSTEKPSLRTKPSLPQLITGVIAGVVLCLLYQWTAQLGTRTHRYDNDHDGKPDEVSIYRNGRMIEWAQDRNLDGTLDRWIYYGDDGMQSRAQADDNFDGKPDVFWTFTNNVTVNSRQDTDFNETPDVTYIFQNDLAKQADWRPNGTNIISLRQFFQHGVFTEEWRDTNMDGTFDIAIHFDAFQNPVGTNMPKLISPGQK